MPKRKAVVNDEKQSNSNKSTSQKQTSFKVLLARKSVSQENEEDIPSSRNLFTIPQNDEKTSSQKPSVKIRIPGSKSIALSSPNLKTGPKNLATKLVLRPTPPGKKSKSLTKGSMENNQKELAKSQVSISSEDRSNSPELSLKEEKVIKKPRNPRGESVEDSHKRQKKRSNQRERNKSLMVISSSEGEDEENDMEEEKPVKNQRISKRIANNKDKSKKKNETQKKEEKTKEPKNKKGVKAKDISSEIIITDELSEVEDVEPLLEKPGEKKSKIQRKVARKEKERITRNENKLPEFPAKEEDVGRLIVQAVNEMKSDDLEGKILEYFKKKFRSIDRKNVQTIIQHIQFSAKLRFDRGRKTITIEEESLSELSSEMSIEEISKEAPKKSQRGRKKKEVLKIEEKIEVEEEKQSLIMDETIKQEVKEEEVPQKKKRGRPKKVIEEIEIKDEEIIKKEEYIESDTRKSKAESESVKIEGDLDIKVEEEIKPKRRRGRPASNARDKEVEKYLEEKVISEFKASFIKIEDDKSIEEKIEHDANEHKPKKRGRKSKQALQEEMLNIQQKIEVISEDNSQIKTKTEEENRSPSKKNRKQTKSKIDENLVDLIINIHKDDGKKEASEATLFSNPEIKEEEKEKPKKKAKKGNNAKGDIVVVGETPEKPTKGRRSSKELEKALHDDLLEVISLNIERRATEEEKNVQEKQEKKQKKEKSKAVEIDLTSEGVMSIDKEKVKKEAEKKEKKSGEEKDQKNERKKNKPKEGKVNGNDNKENANKTKESSILNIDEKGDSEKPAGFDSLQADQKKEKATNKNKKVESKETLKEKEVSKNNIISIESSDEKGKKNGMTTTEKKRRHLLLDNERMKDKLRQNLVKIFEGQRSRLSFDNKPRANGGEGSVLGEKNNVLKALPKTENGEKANKQESKQNTQTFIEIDDPTPKKEMIIESEYKDVPQITKMDSLEHQTPLKIINIIEESAVKPPSTIFTKFNMHHDPFKMTPVIDTNQKEDNLLTLESPGGNNLDLDCISIVSSRIESTIQKNDYLKREDIFELRENRDMSERLMEIEHERDESNNDIEEERYNIEQYEPAVGKKRKMNENLVEYNTGSLGETIKIMQETFPMRDSQENEFSISKFLN